MEGPKKSSAARAMQAFKTVRCLGRSPLSNSYKEPPQRNPILSIEVSYLGSTRDANPTSEFMQNGRSHFCKHSSRTPKVHRITTNRSADSKPRPSTLSPKPFRGGPFCSPSGLEPKSKNLQTQSPTQTRAARPWKL